MTLMLFPSGDFYVLRQSKDEKFVTEMKIVVWYVDLALSTG